MKNEKIIFFFEKLKFSHPIYTRASEQKKWEILEVFDYIFVELEKLGVPRVFSEALLIWEKEFVDSFKDVELKDQEGKPFHPLLLTAEKVVKNAVDPKPTKTIGLFEQPVEAELVQEGMVVAVDPLIDVAKKVKAGSALVFHNETLLPSNGTTVVNGVPLDQSVSDQVAMAEEVFGVKATDMTPLEIREATLAKKYHALVWKSVKSKGDKAQIEIVVELPVIIEEQVDA